MVTVSVLSAPIFQPTHLGFVFTVALRQVYIFRFSPATPSAGYRDQRFYLTTDSVALSNQLHNVVVGDDEHEGN